MDQFLSTSHCHFLNQQWQQGVWNMLSSNCLKLGGGPVELIYCAMYIILFIDCLKQVCTKPKAWNLAFGVLYFLSPQPLFANIYNQLWYVTGLLTKGSVRCYLTLVSKIHCHICFPGSWGFTVQNKTNKCAFVCKYQQIIATGPTQMQWKVTWCNLS